MHFATNGDRVLMKHDPAPQKVDITNAQCRAVNREGLRRMWKGSKASRRAAALIAERWDLSA